MKNLPLVFFGVFAVLAASWLGIVFASQQMLGDMEPTSSQLINPVTTDPIVGPYYFEEGSDTKRKGVSVYTEQQYPARHLGLADEGERVYRSLGCYNCHTQNVRDPEYAYDAKRGWGLRESVARDYIRRETVMLGDVRIGPDLANAGIRQDKPDYYHIKIYRSAYVNPRSYMPSYPFLYKKQLIQGAESSPGAVRLPSPDDAYEIVPSRRAEALVAYLMSLHQDYALPEAPLPEE